MSASKAAQKERGCAGGKHSLMDLNAANDWRVVAGCVGGTHLVRQHARVGKFVEDCVGNRPSRRRVDEQLLSGGVDGPFEINNV